MRIHLTGRFNMVSSEKFEHVIMATEQQKFLMASDAGYGFVGLFADMLSKNKAGKAYLSLPNASKVLTPVRVNDIATDMCLSISNEGRMLLFPLRDLPSLGKGKGNKIINIPSAKSKTREEFVVAIAVVPLGSDVKVLAGKRGMTLKAADLEHYYGERGRRGNKLPRGLQRVDGIEVLNGHSDDTVDEELIDPSIEPEGESNTPAINPAPPQSDDLFGED
jgi:topoisomerase-4 subunit A